MALDPEVLARLEVIDDNLTNERYYVDPERNAGTTYNGKTVIANITYEQLHRYPNTERILWDNFTGRSEADA